MKILGTFYPERFDDKKPLKSWKQIKLCFDDFYANFGVPYLSILFISMNIPAAALLLLQWKHTEEIVTCLNQKFWCGSSLNMQNNICVKKINLQTMTFIHKILW